jgi:hypothetical protein
VTWLMWNLILVRLETVLVSEQDRCTVCAKRTIGSEIGLDAPNRTPMWKLVSVHLEIVLILTQDRCIVYAERTIGSEIILDTPDGAPR